jgi:hypothetical protein
MFTLVDASRKTSLTQISNPHGLRFLVLSRCPDRKKVLTHFNHVGQDKGLVVKRSHVLVVVII